MARLLVMALVAAVIVYALTRFLRPRRLFLIRVQQGGGQILHGPMEVPGGSWIVQCTDPQGALFALLEPHR